MLNHVWIWVEMTGTFVYIYFFCTQSNIRNNFVDLLSLSTCWQYDMLTLRPMYEMDACIHIAEFFIVIIWQINDVDTDWRFLSFSLSHTLTPVTVFLARSSRAKIDKIAKIKYKNQLHASHSDDVFALKCYRNFDSLDMRFLFVEFLTIEQTNEKKQLPSNLPCVELDCNRDRFVLRDSRTKNHFHGRCTGVPPGMDYLHRNRSADAKIKTNNWTLNTKSNDILFANQRLLFHHKNAYMCSLIRTHRKANIAHHTQSHMHTKLNLLSLALKLPTASRNSFRFCSARIQIRVASSTYAIWN